MPPASWSSAEEQIPVVDEADVAIVQGRIRRLAGRLGFDRQGQWELAIAVSEAATNIVKHAGRGQVVLRWQEREESFVEFEAVDEGEGIGEVALAMLDGVSEGKNSSEHDDLRSRRGLGYGLGGIKRLMDELVIENRLGGGLSVRARKYRSADGR